MQIITLESCHSTWIFDTRQLRFCRILRGIAVGQRRISTGWRPYWDLEIDPRGESFTVMLNEQRTRLIRPSIHTDNCACGTVRASRLSLEGIQHAVA